MGLPVQLRLQPLVEHRGVGLAAGGFHGLADEEAEQLVLAGFIFRDLVGVFGEDVVDGGVDGAGIGDLADRRAVFGLSLA